MAQLLSGKGYVSMPPGDEVSRDAVSVNVEEEEVKASNGVNNEVASLKAERKETQFGANVNERRILPSNRTDVSTIYSRRRLVYKNGECNISHENISKSRRRYLADIFTTLVDIKWRWSFCVFSSGFVISWLLFGFVWWAIAWAHGDLGPDRPSSTIPCVAGVESFTAAFLFSIETQHTIGYGSRASTDECPEAVLLQMIQSCFGVIIQALMTGLVFSKLARPKRRAETLLFSKNAVICQRDGTYCLLFRIGDIRKSHIIEAHVRAYVIKRRVTQEGEVIPMEAYDVNLGYDKGWDRVFLVWPLLLCHEIDEASPFWNLSSNSLLKEHFELVVILEGILESTGMTAQARSSYLPNEILWGHRFERLTSFHDDHYRVDYARFHCTVPVSMPRASAAEYKRMETIKRATTTTTTKDDDMAVALAAPPIGAEKRLRIERKSTTSGAFDAASSSSSLASSLSKAEVEAEAEAEAEARVVERSVDAVWENNDECRLVE